MLALPSAASADRLRRCEGIGRSITQLKAKGIDCDAARTMSAKWAETAASRGAARVVRIDGARCVRSRPPAKAVRCSARREALVVSFRYRLP